MLPLIVKAIGNHFFKFDIFYFLLFAFIYFFFITRYKRLLLPLSHFVDVKSESVFYIRKNSGVENKDC